MTNETRNNNRRVSKTISNKFTWDVTSIVWDKPAKKSKTSKKTSKS